MKMQSTEEPEADNNDQHQAQGAADPRATIATITIIAAAPAEQQDNEDNDQDCAHFATLLSTSDKRLIDIAITNGATDGRKNLKTSIAA
jgi:hypothetical protein